MIVWVLDVVGYDARGGEAYVFSSVEKAKAYIPEVEWVEWEQEQGWQEAPHWEGWLGDMWVIYPRHVDEAAS